MTLSGRQYSLAKALLGDMPRSGSYVISRSDASKFDQRTFGSFGKRKYVVVRSSDTLVVSSQLREDMAEFESGEIFRKVNSLNLAKYFEAVIGQRSKVVRMKRRKIA